MKNKKLVIVLVCVLIFAGVFGRLFFNKVKNNETIEEVVSDTLSVSKYSTDISYVCKNSRGDFSEEGTLEYEKESGAKLNLGYVEQFFSEDKIKIHYFADEEKKIEDKEYIVDRSYDEFYRYFMINEISQYLKEESTIYKLDEQDNNIILVEFLTESKNINFHKALLTIDRKNKVVKSLTIYDDKDKVRIEVNYSNFKKLK